MPGTWSTATECQNIQGTSFGGYPIAKLKQKYQEMSGSGRTTCCAEGCGKPYQATAHVQVNDGRKNNGTFEWWLVPTCAEHNRYSTHPTFIANPSTVFVKVSDLVSEMGH